MTVSEQAGERDASADYDDGDMVLWVVWGGVVLVLLLILTVGAIHWPLSLLTGSWNHVGVGVAAVPLAAIAGGASTGTSVGTALRSAWKPRPALFAAALVVIGVYWLWIGGQAGGFPLCLC